ncbi:threonine--tRNA ligase [Candidatus Gracilibacteria bacterium]|nr:threonine--tRNA ligase [Candidatus Gracilibacteria bacterium]MCF7819003.1 threonine--tRNA ligase [Candidatus Gracilibacteria bacterium]
MNKSASDFEIRRRHTGSHVMTAAVKMIFPDIKRGVGPWTDKEFYQDFDFGEEKISESDLKKIEKKMRWIVNKDFSIEQKICSIKEAKEHFEGDEYKQELIRGLEEKGEKISIYAFADERDNVFYDDLCAGPHLESTGQLGVFKLTRLAGAYWRGNENNKMLTRIYGVAFKDKEELQKYEEMLAEAERRDHRKLGAELGLFAFSEKVGAGLPLFTPKGTFIRNKIADTIQEIQEQYGYEKVCIPHITKKDLYETSGHWQKFKEDLFHVKGKGDTEFVMKPMNCPHHTQIYASQMRSYRDLPVRFSEVTTCYRDEQPGELLGLSRVRSLTQDDGHVFCRMDQVKQEACNIVKVVREFYTKLGMFEEGKFWVSLSVRDPQEIEKYLGDPKNWEKAEKFLEEIAKEEKLHAKRIEGEAAFYGPKLDFMFQDALGREWQLATIQIDFVMPERFGLEYINEKGEKDRPIMIHRAIAGSLERFMSVIIEHFAGAFPSWLAPVQAHILPVAGQHEKYAAQILQQIENVNGRAELHDASETLGKRIRNSQKQKIPFALIVGDKEVNDTTVTVRRYGEEKDQAMKMEEFLGLLK